MTRVLTHDLGQLRVQLDEALEPLRCTEPARGVPWLDHCAACCYGTGFAVSSEEEERLADALNEAINAIDAYVNGDARVPVSETSDG